MVLDEEKRTRTLFFVIDTSRYTDGGVINAINSAIESVISSIKAVLEEYPELNVQFKAAILEFSGESATMSTPEDITGYKWKNLEAKNCEAKFSLACKKLNDILTDDGGYADNSYQAIILIACDEDDIDGYRALIDLEKNPRFKRAYRMAIAVGNAPNMEMLKKFTGNDVNAVSANTTKYLYKLIRNMSFYAAQFGLDDEKFVQLLQKDSEDGWNWGIGGGMEA